MALNSIENYTKILLRKPAKITIKFEKAHLVYIAVFSWFLTASESRFERFISQRLVHVQQQALYFTVGQPREDLARAGSGTKLHLPGRECVCVGCCEPKVSRGFPLSGRV